MLSRVCISLLLVTIGLQYTCVGAGVLPRTTRLAADSEVTPIAATQHSSTDMETSTPVSSTMPTEKSTATSGTESGSGQDGVQTSQQPASESSTQAPTANYECVLPWSGHEWAGNCMKTYEVVNVATTQTTCKDVPVEEEKCSFQWSSECFTDYTKCIQCYTVVTGNNRVCTEEEILVEHILPRNRVHLNDHLGYFTPVSNDQEHYSPSSEIVWQLEAMEGHNVYLELTQIDLHNEDGKCSDYIEISFNPCTPPTKICDNRAKSYTWAASQSKVQVRFVSDHSQHTSGNGFTGAYYYYPVNTSNPFEDAQRRLKETMSVASNVTARSVVRSRRRREVLKQLYASGMLTESRADSTDVIHHSRSPKAKSLPLTKRRLLCIGEILDSRRGTKYISDPQCQQLAKVFNTEGFYSP